MKSGHGFRIGLREQGRAERAEAEGGVAALFFPGPAGASNHHEDETSGRAPELREPGRSSLPV
jgi:hypothetical protein